MTLARPPLAPLLLFAAVADYLKHASIKNKALQRAIDEVRQPAVLANVPAAACELLPGWQMPAVPWRQQLVAADWCMTIRLPLCGLHSIHGTALECLRTQVHPRHLPLCVQAWVYGLQRQRPDVNW